MPNEINLFGIIGRTQDGTGVTAQQVKTMLASLDQTQPLVVRIDSDGGSVFDGLSIYEAFNSYPGPKKAIIESTAFSIASYIAMAFDEVEIAENGYVMIHEPASSVDGTAGELAKSAELLTKLDQSMVAAYASKTGMSQDAARLLMHNETFMNAQEALDYGFVDSINASKVATRLTPQASHRKYLPQRVYASLFGDAPNGDKREETKELPVSDTQNVVAATIDEIEAAFPKMKPATVLACIKAKKPMASVATAAVEELMAENQELTARIAAMEEEMASAKSTAMEEEEEVVVEEEVDAMEEEEVEAKAKARIGVKPVARSKSSSPAKTATATWEATVQACLPRTGGSKMKAAALANRENPGLRERMIAEANRK
jgi:ATP-dependent protease ClpP protease subunit